MRLDEGLKAYKFINAANKLLDEPRLAEYAELSFKQVGHLFDKTLYDRFYDQMLVEHPLPEQAVMDDRNFPDRLRWAKRMFKQYNPKTILDLGCSEGSYSLNIAKAGYDVTGVNLFKESIELATRRAQSFGLSDSCRFVQSDILDYKTDKKYDAVMLFEVIEHVADPDAVVAHMMDLTTPDGICYISTPNGTADEASTCLGVDLENAAAGEFKGHVRAYTEESLRELVKDYEVLDFYHSETDSMPLLHVAFKRKNA